jgi:hypothetical protein
MGVDRGPGLEFSRVKSGQELRIIDRYFKRGLTCPTVSATELEGDFLERIDTTGHQDFEQEFEA